MVSARLLDGYRVERYWVDVLDFDGVKQGELDGVIGGNITCSTDARIKRGGSLELKRAESRSWWGNVLLQVWVEANGEAWSLGVFFPSSPRSSYQSSTVSLTVDLSDKLLIFDEDMVTEAYTVAPETDLVSHVVHMIRDEGQNNVSITPFDPNVADAFLAPTGRNKRAMTWDAGTPKLTIINDILDYVGYFSLSVNGEGQYHSEPYIIPAERPVKWHIHEGETALFASEWEFEQDLQTIPNRIVYSTAEAEGQDGVVIPPMVSSWENTDDTSPYSRQNRGRWITESKLDAEAENQEELDKMVQRRVKNAMNPMAKVTIDHAVMPFELNDIVDFESDEHHVRASVRKWEVSLTPGSLMTVTLRKVNSDDDRETELGGLV